MRLQTMWYVRPAKVQTSLPICAVLSEPLLVAWIFYECSATDRTSFGVSMPKRWLQRIVWVYTCENVTLLEITCCGSFCFNSLPASEGFCLLLLFVNSLDPYQAQQNVGPDLDPNCLTLWWHSWKNFLKKLLLKKSGNNKKSWKFFQNALWKDRSKSGQSWIEARWTEASLFQQFCLFAYFGSLRPSQQFFSHVWTGLGGLNQY